MYGPITVFGLLLLKSNLALFIFSKILVCFSDYKYKNFIKLQLIYETFHFNIRNKTLCQCMLLFVVHALVKYYLNQSTSHQFLCPHISKYTGSFENKKIKKQFVVFNIRTLKFCLSGQTNTLKYYSVYVK